MSRRPLRLALTYLVVLAAPVVGCVGSPLGSPHGTDTPRPSASRAVTAEPSAAAATGTPAVTPIPSLAATPTAVPTSGPSAPAPTRSPEGRCGQPFVDPTVELAMESRILEEADTITSAIPFDGGLLLAGWLVERAGGRAAVWRSDDAETWERSEPEALGSGHVFDLLATNAGLLGVGGNIGPSDLGDAAVWRSVDGVTWEQVASPALELGNQYGSAFRAAEGGPGYVVVGSQHTFSEVNVAVWLSSDGLTWETVAPVDEFDSAFPNSLLVRDDGLIVVGINICDETGCTKGGVLTSRDGREWERHRESRGSPESITPALHAIIEAGPSEMLGIGTSYEEGPLVEVNDHASGVWHSADGLHWEITPGPESGRGLTVADGRFFATGTWGAECQRQNPSVWMSADGRDWQPVWVGIGGESIERLSTWQGRLVMIGTVPDFAAQVFRSAVWVESR